jgi:hypothetical protein
MLRALIWTYEKPNSVQGARRYGPRITCCTDKSEIRQIILLGYFGDLIFASKETNKYQS